VAVTSHLIICIYIYELPTLPIKNQLFYYTFDSLSRSFQQVMSPEDALIRGVSLKLYQTRLSRLGRIFVLYRRRTINRSIKSTLPSYARMWALRTCSNWAPDLKPPVVEPPVMEPPIFGASCFRPPVLDLPFWTYRFRTYRLDLPFLEAHIWSNQLPTLYQSSKNGRSKR